MKIGRAIELPNGFGQTGDVLVSQGSGSAALWSQVTLPGSKAHGYATYKDASGSLVVTTTGSKGKDTNNWTSIHPENNGNHHNWNSKLDVDYTSLHGMLATYTPVGVTFLPSTQPLSPLNGTVSFTNNPLAYAGSSSRLTPCRWRILTDGIYRVQGDTKINDSKPVSKISLMLWRRTGGSISNPGQTLERIGLADQSGNFGDNQYNQQGLGTNLSIDGIYELEAYDEIYFSVNGDSTNGGYAGNILTHMSIQEI